DVHQSTACRGDYRVRVKFDEPILLLATINQPAARRTIKWMLLQPPCDVLMASPPTLYIIPRALAHTIDRHCIADALEQLGRQFVLASGLVRHVVSVFYPARQ
ncbi:hypothetical protein, partial [Burkholderia cenocepacia]